MELFHYLDNIEKKLQGNFDLHRNYMINNTYYNLFAEYHLRNEKYIFTRKAVVYAFENNEYTLIKYCDILNKHKLDEFISEAVNSVKFIVKPGKEHMSSIVTLVIASGDIFKEDLIEIKKTILHFSYNKGFAFGFKGWADMRLILISLKEGLIAANKKGKEVTSIYNF